MMTKKGLMTGVLLMAGLLFISCDSFFSSSWGSPRDYDSANINVNAGNVDEWVTRAKGDPDLAGKVVEKIKEDLKEKVKQGEPTEDQAKLQDGGTKLAVESSNMGKAILETVGKLAGSGDMIETMELLTSLQESFKNNNGAKAAENLCIIVSGSLEKPAAAYTTGDKPRFGKNSLYAKNANPEDVGQAILLLTLTVVGKGTEAVEGKDIQDVDLKDLTEQGIEIVVNNGKKEAAVTGENPSREAVTLAAYLNLINDDPAKYNANPVTKGMRESFFGA